MIERILEFSMRQRTLVLLLAAALLGGGLYSVPHLPIDAVPDITVVTHIEPLEDPRSFADEGLDRRALPPFVARPPGLG